MEEKLSRGNRTVNKLVSVKIKNQADSHMKQNFYRRKVWTVNDIDVEWLTVELADDTEEIISIQNEIIRVKQSNQNHSILGKLE